MTQHTDLPAEPLLARLWNANPALRDGLLVISPVVAVVIAVLLSGGDAGAAGGGG